MRRLLLCLLLLGAQGAWADTLRVAVAANFAGTARVLAERFEAASGHRLKLAFGSTGKHYAQITHGAPFDAFLAADRERPERLEAEGRVVPASRFTYALGRLVLWSPRPNLLADGGQALANGDFAHLAIANPRLAPYGKAARQVLERLALWDALQDKLVRGENIAQTYHFVRSGNAKLGFVALSQLHQPGAPAGGSRWEPPMSLYDPIEQQAVLLRDTAAGQAWLRFLRSPEAQALIRDHGYRSLHEPADS